MAASAVERAARTGAFVWTGDALAPLVVPLIIAAVAIFFFYAWVGLVGSFAGLVLAHTALALPFVVITVTATLQGYDTALSRAAASLGAPPLLVFRQVELPMILPGV